jgi:putative chitinase
MVTASAVQARFAPKAKDNYIKTFQLGQPLLDQAGVDTPLRLAHFMAQVMHETGGLAILTESGRYTRKALGAMWDGGNWHRYFANRAACLAMADTCAADSGEALFNVVYANRMGNGPPSSGDGWKYRGHGLLQTTGRDAYKRYGQLCQVPFVDDPGLVLDPRHALKPAIAEWTRHDLNAAADASDIEVITQRINGGLIGLAQRKAWFAKIWPFVTGGTPVEHSTEWKVQQALTAAGFDTKGVDGVIGKDTRSAILAFRAARNLPGPPQITDDLLLTLHLSTA